MIAVDTNVLVHAHRRDSPQHDSARSALADLAERRSWAVPWPCLHEFLAVVTHPRVWLPPSPVDDALRSVADLLGLGVQPLSETGSHAEILTDLLTRSGVSGPRVHDARVAAICLGHEVDELWTADRDFSYFPGLRTRNPLVS